VDEFAESVVYRTASGTESTVLAIVDRSPLEVLGPKGDVLQPKFTVTLYEIDAKDVNTGGDKIKLKLHENDVSNTTYSVLMIIYQSHNCIKLAVG